MFEYVGSYMQQMNNDVLEVKSLTKTYKKSALPANDAISLTCYPGQLTALVGHNGAGKTTFLSQLVGLLKPDSGDAVFRGTSLVKQPAFARKVITMMPQLYAPLTGVTVRQAIESIALIRGAAKSEARIRTDSLLAALDISGSASVSGEKLSGGLQRLTSFAMACVYPAPIILLDEPTNDVDPIRRKKVWAYIKTLAQAHHIVLVVTHNLLEVEKYADRFILFDHGTIREDIAIKSLHRIRHSAVLTLEAPGGLQKDEIPDYARVIVVENNADMLSLVLPYQRLSDALQWMSLLIERGRIVNYRLASHFLETLYEKYINGGNTHAE